MITARRWEAISPYLLAIAILAAWWLGLKRPFPMPASGLLGASGGAAAVLVGFLATAKTIILSVSNTDVFKNMKAHKFAASFFRYIFEAIWAGLLFLVFSLLGFFIDTATAAMPVAYTAVWVLLASVALTTYGRVMVLLSALLHRI